MKVIVFGVRGDQGFISPHERIGMFTWWGFVGAIRCFHSENSTLKTYHAYCLPYRTYVPNTYYTYLT